MKSYLPGLRNPDNPLEAVDITEFHTPQTFRRYRIYLRLWRWHIPLFTIKTNARRKAKHD